MKLKHITKETCPQCNARAKAQTQDHQHSSGEWNESRTFDCGLTVKYSPNFCKELVEGLCRNSKAYRDACDKRKVAVDKTAAFIDSLDVDEGFKTKMTRELRYYDSIYSIY